MWLIALLACSSVLAPPPPLAPDRVDRSAASVSLGLPGPGTVGVVAFAISDGGDWALAGGFTDAEGLAQRWTVRVAADGAVAHRLHGPGSLQDVDFDQRGVLWTCGFGTKGKAWVGGIDPTGAVVTELVYEGPVGGELWSIEGLEDGAVALGIQIPLSMGNAHALWLEVGPDGVRGEKLGRGMAYAYANDLAVAPDGTAVAVGTEAHRGQWYTVEPERLRGRTFLADAVQGLDQVVWTSEGWLALARTRYLSDGPPPGQLALYRVAAEGEPELVAVSRVGGPPGDPKSLTVVGSEVWLHTVGIHGNRFEATDHRVFRLVGDELKQVGPEHVGWGAVAVGPDGVPWRAWSAEGGVQVERL